MLYPSPLGYNVLPDMPDFKAVVFDLDNTLVDFSRMKQAAVEAAAEAMVDAGLDAPREELIQGIYEVYQERGIEAQDVFNRFLESRLGKVDYKILAAAVVAYRRAKTGNMRLFPGVRWTLLELMRAGVDIAILTDAPGLQAWTRLVEMNLHQYFDLVITLDDTGETKPSRKAFETVLQRLGLPAEQTLMVGDWAERDMVGAQNVGMKTAFARYGALEKTVPPGVDYVLEKPTELVAVVKP